MLTEFVRAVIERRELENEKPKTQKTESDCRGNAQAAPAGEPHDGAQPASTKGCAEPLETTMGRAPAVGRVDEAQRAAATERVTSLGRIRQDTRVLGVDSWDQAEQLAYALAINSGINIHMRRAETQLHITQIGTIDLIAVIQVREAQALDNNLTDFDREGGSCPECGEPAHLFVCDDCGLRAWLVDCGHFWQPRPIATWGHHTYCDSCADAHEEED